MDTTDQEAPLHLHSLAHADPVAFHDEDMIEQQMSLAVFRMAGKNLTQDASRLRGASLSDQGRGEHKQGLVRAGIAPCYPVFAHLNEAASRQGDGRLSSPIAR